MTARPADAARRALREAREAREKADREKADREKTTDADGLRAPFGRAEDQPRAKGTGDDAPARPGGAATDRTEDAAKSRAEAPEALESEGERSRRQEARPADVAREALRAARSEARQAHGDAMPPEGGGAPRGEALRRPGRTAATSRERGPAAVRPDASVRARDLRALLADVADAFRMPDMAVTPEGDPGDEHGERHEGPGPLTGTPTPATTPEDVGAADTRPASALSTARTATRPSTSGSAPADLDFRLPPSAPAGPGSRLSPPVAADLGSPLSSSAPADPGSRLSSSVPADPGSRLSSSVSADPGSRLSSSAPADPGSPLPPPAHVGPGFPSATLPPVTPTPPPWPHGTAPSTPAPPRHPRSMAAPARDGELRRTFPAFPALPSGGGGFAETWWGNAWVAALEEGTLDTQRLVRGRGYAEQGHVDAITVTPGLVLAYVQGSRPRPYRVQVRLRTLDDADWDRFLHSAAERPADIAALLDREMPHTLADSGVPLLPGPGDLDPRCSCPDSGHPCKHAAALCYQTARLLDADPFVLLLLRGRGEHELLGALSRLSAARAARAAQERGPAPLPGVRATDALKPRQLPPLPAPLPTPRHPEQPPVYPATAGGPDPFALDQLATDAATRAHALLATGRDPVGELTLWQDAVRLAAARPGSGLTAGTRALYSSLTSATGRAPGDLARAVAAWRQGGLEGLSVLEEPWDPPAGRFDRARPLLLAADLPAFRPWHNHLTHPRGHVQLRLGRDGLWYAYESEPAHDDWWPRGTPDLDPVGALTGL
ncbi:putative Zn finger protein [Streptomyces sp. LBL]|uniref:SWIM zinc finger family protein n=1 Tax=Streptomyces sp. LBL TaxID=2940562 RepID=UPI002474DEA5|nr:SWIM zinc finger family protein [Streptomyces sp. LBL]MDH6624706.1 putative Zn finger protein [Streptomyces sp. LBL]